MPIKDLFPLDERHNHNGITSEKLLFKNLADVSNTIISYNPGNITAGSAEITDFTVKNASLKDFVLVSAPYDLQTIIVSGYVAGSGTVTLNLYNSGDAAVNLGQGSAWIIKLIKS